VKLHKGLVLLFAIPVIVAGCDTQRACEVRPTTMATQPDGTVACFEADGDLCDDDPCDEDDHNVKPINPKPKTVKRK
jgi:hypothetical protein